MPPPRSATPTGTQVTTVEGLGPPEDLSPVQQAFVHYYAAQCGFCTSGMLLAAQAYIDRGGADDPEAIQHALAGHVCRCTGYSKIIDAVAAAARGDSFDLTTTAVRKHTTMSNGGGGMKVVGARIPRYDGVAHVTGRTTYVDDVRVPGTLWAKALRSPHPPRGDHEASTRRKAESMPGVHAVITWKDVPLLEYGHLSALGHPGGRAAAREGRGALPRTSRSRSSQPRASAGAAAAVDAIEVGFEERPALLDVRQAFDADAPKIHQWGNWYPHFEDEMDRPPDPQGRHRLGLRERGHDRPGRLSARRDRARADRDAGLPGRPRAGRPADRSTPCTQALYFSLGVVAAHLQQPLNRFKLVGGTTGGGFGGKVDTATETMTCLLVA